MHTTTSTVSSHTRQPTLVADMADFAGRFMLALIFIVAGYGKLGGYEGNLAYMASYGLPGFLLPPTIALELLGGLALVAGFQTRLVALALALFSLASAAIFHSQFSDPMQSIMFMKNIAIAGGLLLLASKPLGHWTLDHKRAG
jgi:putative oxidoreductase